MSASSTSGNFLYTPFVTALMSGSVNLTTADVRAILVKSSYVPNQSTHDFLNDVPSGDRVGSPVALTGESVSAGVFDANDVTFSSVAAGSTVAAVVLYIYNASETAARLIGYFGAIEGFPAATNGGNITISWSGGARKIFKIGS